MKLSIYKTFVLMCLLCFFLPFTMNAKSGLDGAKKKTLPITGTWLNLPYKDVRNKYTNPQNFDNTSPELWASKVRELASMGMEYLVLMEVANDGKAYYPSSIMEWHYDKAVKSPVQAILDEAAKHKMKVFMSTGWAKNHDDDMKDPWTKERQLLIMDEVASLYKNHKAFYGWYLPAEDCTCPILPEHAVLAVNALVDKAKELTPDKKTLISPYGLGLADFNNPDFEKQIAKLKVDIIAYQDEVGCVRDQFTLPRLKKNWKKLREIHDKLNIELWANCETFTWQEGTNDRNSALLPAAYSRLLSQQIAASEASVDRIISFMFAGIIESPNSKFQLGQPMWSNVVYNDYMSWSNGGSYWKLMEQSLSKNLENGLNPSMFVNPEYSMLADGVLGEESTEDLAWLKLTEGHHFIVVDLGGKTKLNDVLVRCLDYRLGGVSTPDKMYVYTSVNGVDFQLTSIVDAPYFPNNKHDAWINGVYFENLNCEATHLKIEFDVEGIACVDEVFVNPKAITNN